MLAGCIFKFWSVFCTLFNSQYLRNHIKGSFTYDVSLNIKKFDPPLSQSAKNQFHFDQKYKRNQNVTETSSPPPGWRYIWTIPLLGQNNLVELFHPLMFSFCKGFKGFRWSPWFHISIVFWFSPAYALKSFEGVHFKSNHKWEMQNINSLMTFLMTF